MKDLGKIKQAEASTLKALSIDPKLIDAITNLAGNYDSQGQTEKAFNAYYKALQISKDNILICTLTAQFLENNYQFKFNKSNLKVLLNILFDRKDINHRPLFMLLNYLYSEISFPIKYR